MQGEVVGAGEAALARATHERLSAGVLAQMACKLVRTGKAPLTLAEVTRVRLLS